MSTKDFKTRNEILVEIGDGEDDGTGGGAEKTRKPGAIVKPRKAPRSYLPRRSGGGDLFFYDPAVTKSGSNYFDVNYQIITDWTNTGGGGLPFPSPITDADWQARDALVIANLGNAGQITPDYTDQIGIFIEFDGDPVFLTTGENEDIWTNAGLKVTAAQFAAETISVGYFNLDFGDVINLQGDGANKITETFDYAAAAFDFKLHIKDKIYFVPAICKTLAEENFPGHFGFFSFNQQLNFFWLFTPRAPYINETDPIDARFLLNNRVMRSTQAFSGDVWTNTQLSGAAFETVVTNGIFRTDLAPDASLSALIVRGDQTFYVWKGLA